MFSIENKKTKFKYTNNLTILSNRLDICTCYIFLVRDNEGKVLVWVRVSETKFYTRVCQQKILVEFVNGQLITKLAKLKDLHHLQQVLTKTGSQQFHDLLVPAIGLEGDEDDIEYEENHQLMTLIKTGKSDQGPDVIYL